MGIRRRRRKLTTLVSNLDQRVKSVELRPISLLTEGQVQSAIESGAASANPVTVRGIAAPAQFRKIEDAYIYPKRITGNEDRVEIYLESDLGLAVGDRLQVSGIHGTQNANLDASSDNFTVKSVDTPPWTGRTLPGNRTKHDPTTDQRPGVVISNTYSFKPETVAPSSWNQAYRLQTKRQVSTFSITGTTVTLVMNSAHKFKAGDIVFVDIFAADSRAFGVDGLFTITSVTNTTIVYTLPAGVPTPVPATTPATPFFVFPVARKFLAVGSTWIDSATDKIYYWDGIRWLDYSTVTDPVQDGDPPAPPTALRFSNNNVSFFGNNSVPVATFTVSWTAPTKTSKDKELTDLVGYTLKYRADPADPWTTVDIRGGDTSYKFANSEQLQQGTLYYFQVIAYDSGLQPSTPLSGTHTTRTGPISSLTAIRPTPLTSTVYLGTFTLIWDGKVENTSSVQQPLPPGLSTVYVYASTTSSTFVPNDSNLIATFAAIPGNKTVYAENITYGATYYFKAKLMDAAGGSSLFSRTTTATAQAVVDASRISGVIRAANIVPGTVVTGDKIIGLSITGQLIEGNEIHGDVIRANTITAGKIDVGFLASSLLESDVIRTAPVPNSQSRVEITSAGIFARNSSGSRTFALDATTGDVEITGFATIGALGNKISIGGAASDINNNNFEINGTKITDGSIETRKLKANFITVGSAASDINNGVTTINGGKITARSISVGSIATGTLTGFRIQTSDSGERIILSESSNALVFFGSSGETGRITSGSGGNQMTINVPSTFSVNFTVNNSFIASVNTGGITFAPTKGINATSLPISGNVVAGGSIQTGSFIRSGNIATGQSATLGSTGNITGQGSLTIGGTADIDGVLTAAGGIIMTNRTGVGTAFANLNSAGAIIRGAAVGSDLRLKKNIKPINLGLDFVKDLNPIEFEYIDDSNPLDSGTQLGLIAQEVESALESHGVDPNNGVVDKPVDDEGVPDPYYILNMAQLVPTLIKAIQELSSSVAELESRVPPTSDIG